MGPSTRIGSVDVSWLGHASVKLQASDGITVYIDPWSDVMQEGRMRTADIILATHDHDDHFDVKAIQALKKRDTILVCTEASADDVPEDVYHDTVKPDRMVNAHGIRVRGIPAYNTNKFRSPDVPYHPEGVGVSALFDLDGLTFYHAGDTDIIDAMKGLADDDINVAFLPVGGTYTMDQDEAVEAVTHIAPEHVVPIHYGHLDATTADPDRFAADIKEKTDADPIILKPQVL